MNNRDLIVRALLIVAAAAVLYWLMNNYQTKQSTLQAERFYQDALSSQVASSGIKELPYSGNDMQKTSMAEVSSVLPAEEDISSEFRAVDYETKKVASDCFPKDRLTAEDLLPRDAANSKWASVNPAGQGDLQDQNFLTAGFQVGVNTVGSSLRNANQQLRSEPPIKKTQNWPIMNSTIEPDLMRRPLEITGEW